MSLMKYRVHEVAKDFNTTSKVITQILTDYATPPKNHMQVLENPEGLCNQLYVARSKNPNGPFEKWNGNGWGGDPAPIIYYDERDTLTHLHARVLPSCLKRCTP